MIRSGSREGHEWVAGHKQKVDWKHALAQVIEETNGFYQKLKSGERENTEGLSLV